MSNGTFFHFSFQIFSFGYVLSHLPLSFFLLSYYHRDLHYRQDCVGTVTSCYSLEFRIWERESREGEREGERGTERVGEWERGERERERGERENPTAYVRSFASAPSMFTASLFGRWFITHSLGFRLHKTSPWKGQPIIQSTPLRWNNNGANGDTVCSMRQTRIDHPFLSISISLCLSLFLSLSPYLSLYSVLCSLLYSVLSLYRSLHSPLSPVSFSPLWASLLSPFSTLKWFS